MNTIHKIIIPVSKEIGSVSGLLILPKDANSLLVLSHGAGAGMEHPFMEQLAQALGTLNIGTLRFNFAYMENKKGAPDRPPKAQAVIKAALEKAAELSTGLPLLVGGKSFGGRMTSQLAATEDLANVKGIVYYGFPLHAPGKIGIERAAHLNDIPLPQLFLQGTRDTFAKTDLIEEVCAALPLAKLVLIEGGDHSFKMLKRSGITQKEAIQKLAEETAIFAKSL
jgi:predicted alpha/beta-hydrolase family hydrolase